MKEEREKDGEQSSVVTTSKELGKAIKEEKDTIIIEGDLVLLVLV